MAFETVRMRRRWNGQPRESGQPWLQAWRWDSRIEVRELQWLLENRCRRLTGFQRAESLVPTPSIPKLLGSSPKRCLQASPRFYGQSGR